MSHGARGPIITCVILGQPFMQWGWNLVQLFILINTLYLCRDMAQNLFLKFHPLGLVNPSLTFAYGRLQSHRGMPLSIYYWLFYLPKKSGLSWPSFCLYLCTYRAPQSHRQILLSMHCWKLPLLECWARLTFFFPY